MRKNWNEVVLGILTATVAVILFIVCANATGGYSANWRPYAVVLVVLGLYWVRLERRLWIFQKQRELQLLGMTDHINSYLTIPVDIDVECSPYISGKILPINRFSDEPQLVRPQSIQQDIYWNISKELCANSHEQVGTIVWIDLEKKSIGNEEPFQIIRQCRVTIIDRERSIITGETLIEVSDSRYKMPIVAEYGMAVERCSLGWYRNLCDQIIDYLETLPRTRRETIDLGV